MKRLILAVFVGYREWVKIAIVSSVVGSMNILTVPTEIHCCFSFF